MHFILIIKTNINCILHIHILVFYIYILVFYIYIHIDDPLAIKLALKLSSGKPIIRRYLSTDTVRSIFAVALANEPTALNRPFDLMLSFPLTNLSEMLNKTIGEAGLAGTQIVLRWK